MPVQKAPQIEWAGDDCMYHLDKARSKPGTRVKQIVEDFLKRSGLIEKSPLVSPRLHKRTKLIRSLLVLESTHRDQGQTLLMICTPNESDSSVEVSIHFVGPVHLLRNELQPHVDAINAQFTSSAKQPVAKKSDRQDFVSDRVRLATAHSHVVAPSNRQ